MCPSNAVFKSLFYLLLEAKNFSKIHYKTSPSQINPWAEVFTEDLSFFPAAHFRIKDIGQSIITFRL